MKSKKATIKADDFESVKIDKTTVNKVRDYKKKNYMPIGEFFKLAAEEKLEKLTTQSK